MKHLLTFPFLFFFTAVFTQKQVEHVIQSKVFGHERKITVYLPEEYLLDSTSKFPVAYLFDGQFEPYLKMVSGMMEYYSKTNLCLSMVIVAVHTENRFEEFMPEPKMDETNNLLYSTRLTESLEQEVFPFVNANYRTTDFKLGIGHSLGGTFLLYEAFKEQSPFGAVIAASPNTNLNQMSKMIPEYLDHHPQLTTFFYVTGGDTDQMELDFLQTTMQIDSAIIARKSEYPDWNFRKYEHANHMETFPKTFNDGYLLFSETWKVGTKDLALMKGLQDDLLEQEIKKCLRKKSIIQKGEMPYSFRNVLKIQGAAELNSDYRTAFNISTLSLKLLKADSSIPQKDKEDLSVKITDKRDYYLFNDLCNTALDASNRKDYKLAEQEYLRAFETGLIKGTFSQRINCLTAFAQTGNTEEAFKQIELLANTFELRGSGALTENPLLSPLHKDKRWKKYVKILDENTKKGWE